MYVHLSALPSSLAASAPAFDRADIRDYSEKLLRWWRDNNPTIPTWAKAARMVFAMSCTSTASEDGARLLVDSMFGRDQVSSLADQIQTGCMLRFNKRIVG